MDREVVWSVTATADFESIVEYIFRDSQFYAATVAREIIAAARSLSAFADRGRVVPEYQDPTVENCWFGVTASSNASGLSASKC